MFLVLLAVACYCLVAVPSGCSAVSRTAHWTISLSDDGPVSGQSRDVDINKWTVKKNGTTQAKYLIVAAEGNENATVSSPTLPAEAEESESIAESLDPTTTTMASWLSPAFTVFGGPPPNFSPLFGLPLTLPTVASSSTSTAPITTTTITVPESTVSSTTVSANNELTTVANNETSTAASTIVSTDAVDLPTLPPFDMRSLPSLIQIAKLIPAMVRSFGGSSDSFSTILPSGNALNPPISASESLFPALPTSSVVAANDGYGGGLAPTNFAANAAPTFQLPGFIPTGPADLSSQPSRTRDVSPFGNVGELFAVNPTVRPLVVDVRQIPSFESQKQSQYPENVPFPNHSKNFSWTPNDLQRPVHVGTPKDNSIKEEIKENESAEDSPVGPENSRSKVPPSTGWSRGSAERRPSQLSGAERRMRLNLYNTDDSEKAEKQNAIEMPPVEETVVRPSNSLTRLSNNPLEGFDDTFDTTVSPYAAPIPHKMTTVARRERPKFSMATSASDDSNDKREELASTHREIFYKENQNTEVSKRSEENYGISTKPHVLLRDESELTSQKPESFDELKSWPSAQRAEIARQRFAAGPSKVQQRFIASTPSLPEPLAGRLPVGLDATALRELAAVGQLPELGELTRGLDLSLLARPGGYATLRQKFLERLAQRTVQQTEPQKKLQSQQIALRIRRSIID